MKYPKAGDLQRATAVQLTSNPCNCGGGCVHRNPFEIRSDSGLEGVFADEQDAEFYADELRSSGARGVVVSRRQRPSPAKQSKPAWTAYDQYAADQAAGYPYPKRNAPRMLREHWGENTDIVIEQARFGYMGWLENRDSKSRHPISFGERKPETMREAMELAKKFLNRVYGKSNPARRGNPPNVLPVPGQRIKSWDHGDGKLVRICEEGTDGSYTARIQLDDGRRVTVPLTRTEYDLQPRKVLERRTGFSRHEQFIGAPQPERFPRGTPGVEFDDTPAQPMEYSDTLQDFVPLPRRHRIPPRRR